MTAMLKEAIISDCNTYRYSLSRKWGGKEERIVWVMLNPSIADASIDDPTIRRCIKFSEIWGYQQMFVVNLFGLRATNPKELEVVRDPIGPENDIHVRYQISQAEKVVCAWGAWGKLRGKPLEIKAFLGESNAHKLFCLDKTKALHPKHPLYIKGTTLLQIF